MWSDIQAINAEMRVPRDRLRRQYEEFGGTPKNDYQSESSYGQNSNYASEQAVAPTYGYGYAKVKCELLKDEPEEALF